MDCISVGHGGLLIIMYARSLWDLLELTMLLMNCNG
jgi:hypothetical protein